MEDSQKKTDGYLDPTIAGRKVFFLYPHSVLQEQLMELIFQAGYEVYLLREHTKVKRLLSRYPGSILFINIDERIRDTSWEVYVRQFTGPENTYDIRVGILSYNDDPQLARRYIMEMSVQCGFIRLKLSLAESAKILLSVLEANEARGTRKFVRLAVPEDKHITFNVRRDHAFVSGRILDLSVAGMAAAFVDEQDLHPGDTVEDIQLNLRGSIVRVAGKIAGTRKSGDRLIHVILFEIDDAGESRRKLRTFIYASLQAQMDKVLSGL